MSKGGERSGLYFLSPVSKTRANKSELEKESLIQIFRQSMKSCSRLIRKVVQVSSGKIFKYTLVSLSMMSNICGEVGGLRNLPKTLSIYLSVLLSCNAGMICFVFVTFHYSPESPWSFVKLCICLVLHKSNAHCKS